MCGAALVAVLAFALQGCSDSSRQGSELTYGGPAEYANYGYSNDPFAYGPYDPLLYSYWYPQQYYYYPIYAGDGDHDCDDGHCGGSRDGHRPPPPINPRPLAERGTLAGSRPMTATHESFGGGFNSASANGSGFHGGFNGGGGFGGAGGFGGHASGHR